MIASPPIETAVETPSPGGRQRGGDLRGHAAGAAHHADRAGLVGDGGVACRAADAAHLGDAGDDQAEAVGADDPRALGVGQLDHHRDVAARDPLGDDHDRLDAGVQRLEDGVARAGGGDGDDRAVGHDAAVVLDDLLDGVEHRHAVDLAALAAGGHAADDLRAVVEALAREVDRLAPGDALDDEGRVLVDQDRHG